MLRETRKVDVILPKTNKNKKRIKKKAKKLSNRCIETVAGTEPVGEPR
jgi:hypothetical protein